MTGRQVQAPTPLAPGHLVADFDCGENVLNDWLQRRAMANQLSGATRTFVVADAEQRVHGYYALAAGAVAHQVATPAIRRNMPDPVPVLVLARLAVARAAQGEKLGAALLQDAVNRALVVAAHTGVRALLVHALHEPAKRFYEHYGFLTSPGDALIMMLRVRV